MSDELNPFDPEAYPEEARELAKAAAEKYQNLSKYEGLQADPEIINKAVEMYTAYTDPNRSGAYREAMARQWGALPEGMTLDELSDIAKQVAAARNAQVEPADYSYQDDFDPEAFVKHMRDGIINEVKSMFDERDSKLAEKEQEAYVDQQARELERQEMDLYKSLEKRGVELDADDKAALEAMVALRIQREEMSPDNFHTFVEDTWNQFEGLIGKHAASLLKKQGEAPRTGGKNIEGATPGSKTVVNDLASAKKFLEEMLPNG